MNKSSGGEDILLVATKKKSKDGGRIYKCSDFLNSKAKCSNKPYFKATGTNTYVTRMWKKKIF